VVFSDDDDQRSRLRAGGASASLAELEGTDIERRRELAELADPRYFCGFCGFCVERRDRRLVQLLIIL
jgi:hypothetical protein